MRKDSAEVSVASWDTYYYIKDRNTGDLWSRNRWGTATSIPDLYTTTKACNRQRSAGKVSLSTASNGRDPVICTCLFGYESSGIKSP